MNDFSAFNQYEAEQRRKRAEREQLTHSSRIVSEQAQLTQLQQIASELYVAEQQRREAQQQALVKLQAQQQGRGKASPIEELFAAAWLLAYPTIPLERQYKVLKYRLDFAHVESMTAIELDGHQFHSKKRDRNKDYARHHTIESQGWYILRFTGSQIKADLTSCIELVYERIMARLGQAG